MSLLRPAIKISAPSLGESLKSGSEQVLQIWSKWYTSDEYTQEQKTKIQGELDFHKVRDALHQHGFDVSLRSR